MGLGSYVDDDRYSPPFGAHPILYDAVDEVAGPMFRRGPNGEDAEQRRDDYLLGVALFMDVPSSERSKARLYFAASMIAEAPNRDVNTQSAPLNNLTSIVQEEEDGRYSFNGETYDFKVGVIAAAFELIEGKIEKKIRGTDVTKSEVVEETLEGVRSGQSFFERWGDARQEMRDDARERGQGNFNL
jgi:hypothetical protein